MPCGCTLNSSYINGIPQFNRAVNVHNEHLSLIPSGLNYLLAIITSNNSAVAMFLF